MVVVVVMVGHNGVSNFAHDTNPSNLSWRLCVYFTNLLSDRDVVLDKRPEEKL